MIRVDNTTGIVDVVPVYMGHAPMEQAVTPVLPDPLHHSVRAVQSRNRRKRLRGMRRLSYGTTQSSVVGALWNTTQSPIAAQRAQRREHCSSGGRVRQLLQAIQWRGGSCPGSLPEGGASDRRCRGTYNSLDRYHPVRIRLPHRETPGPAGGIRWVLRLLSSARSQRCLRRLRRRQMQRLRGRCNEISATGCGNPSGSAYQASIAPNPVPVRGAADARIPHGRLRRQPGLPHSRIRRLRNRPSIRAGGVLRWNRGLAISKRCRLCHRITTCFIKPKAARGKHEFDGAHYA